MKKIVLVDGNNLLFRSYYATAYSGNLMKNKEGFPTNGIFGFTNMINKIITEEAPDYIAVAFDIGKTFRHKKYESYKQGRNATPNDLLIQFPVAKKVLTALGIKYLECENYEADDIIGTLSKMVDNSDDFEALIVSSDKDLLQLITDKVSVKLLKQKDYILMNPKTFYDTYKIDAIKMIDLKSLMGDSSDNIKGVEGIGEKTALKLLQEYGSLDELYNNLDKLSLSTRNKLISSKEDAYLSKELVTIYTNVPLDISLLDLKYEKEDTNNLINIYNDLGFYSLLKKMDKQNDKKADLKVSIISSIDEINITKPVAIYLNLDNSNYHMANIKGLGVYNEDVSIYIPMHILYKQPSFLTSIEKYTYDYKRLYVSFLYNNIEISGVCFDAMLAAYLLNYTIKEDISYLAQNLDYDIKIFNNKEELTTEQEAYTCVDKAKFIYDTKNKLENSLKEEEIYDFYNEIEFPLSQVLAKMEYNGIDIDKEVLINMGSEIETKLEELKLKIYEVAGCEFNISSPKQLGEVLFEKLNLKHGKKNKTGYSTDVNVLNKLKNEHIIIDYILEYRTLFKLKTTYIDGILNVILDDGKIHTIYTQTLTRTGRLSSLEPNLQNIPARDEYGKKIRKAFIPEGNSKIVSFDYSQIELRIFSHLSNNKDLILAFNNNMDIHTKTAMDIFNVEEDRVDSNMRRTAKAVNFGILYGISSYGLAEELKISSEKANLFIDTYLNRYSGIREYMKEVIEKAKKDGYVKTIMNRKRIIEELNNPKKMIEQMGQRMALNTPIQGSSADIIKKAMVEIDGEFKRKNLKSKMLLQVHDELIFNVYNNELEIVKNIVSYIMENTYKLKVELKVDINIGDNWYDAK